MIGEGKGGGMVMSEYVSQERKGRREGGRKADVAGRG